ncbi:nuclease-related domain-containing protein [Nocardiopsis tropica]|uniref:Nuclease-related domain-containing protein n=2 Tax=Nocardiopsis tropica TaxID=109330 RepID=A0ABU7KR67_9ACTN|nr:nuclease-related domain-containing protein [Nocardiopsis umidischolae]MEE2051793.1 nuclease-related domain-containing protein [Nocardiopsis umidischolae]
MSRTLARDELPAMLGLSIGAGLVGGIGAGILIGPIPGAVLGVVLVLAVGTVVRRRGASYRWRMGAVGERRTGRRLDSLRRRGWVVFHDLSLPGSRANVDHLIIGTSGVYLVDSKYRRGAVRFGGRRGWIRIGKTGGPLLVRSAKYEADAVSRVLSSALGRRVDVTAVLAVHVPRSRFPGWREFSASGVPIMAASAVVPWLRARHALVFSSSEVARVAEVVRERLPAYRQQ